MESRPQNPEFRNNPEIFHPMYLSLIHNTIHTLRVLIDIGSLTLSMLEAAFVV